MSMTYYAVTDDPTELAHWGVKGMKWGIRHDKPRHSGSRRPRSTAYKKAQSKLGKMMKSGIKKAEASWKAYNSPKAKEERFMKKAMQKARNGTLKYGKLTDDQVRRVTDRLALERNARQLGSTESPRYARRIKTAIGEGVLRGTSGYIEERMRVRGRTKGEDAAARRREKYDSRSDVQRERARNKMNEEFYKTAYEEGVNPNNYKYDSSRDRARFISEVKERNKLSDVRKSQRDTFDRSYYSNMGKNAADWVKSRAGEGSKDYKQSQKYPRLSSGSNKYSVTRSTYKPPESNTVIYVDPKGTARQKQRTGRKYTRKNYD